MSHHPPINSTSSPHTAAPSPKRLSHQRAIPPSPDFAPDLDTDLETSTQDSAPSNVNVPFAHRQKFGRDLKTIPIHPPQTHPAQAHPAQFSPVQPKLTLGKPGDRYEQEADRTAAQVMTMRDPYGFFKGPGQQQQVNDSQPIRTMPVQLRGTPLTAPDTFETDLGKHRGSGNPLSEKTRSFMEPRFGADFSGVRIHQAPKEAGAIGAQAFTHGQDIYFNSGKYNPGSSSGKELLAHELTHTIQQTGGELYRKQNKETLKPFKGSDKKEIEAKALQSERPSVNKQTSHSGNGVSQTRVPSSSTDELLSNNNKVTVDTKDLSTQEILPQQTDLEAVNNVAGTQTNQLSQVTDNQTNPLNVSEQGLEQQPEENQQKSTDNQVNNSAVESTAEPAQQDTSSVPIPANGQAEMNSSGNAAPGGATNDMAAPNASSIAKESRGSTGDNPVPQAPVSLSSQDPGQVINQLQNTPPTQLAATYAQAGQASAQALDNQQNSLQALIPEVPAPTGLPAQGIPSETASQNAVGSAPETSQLPALQTIGGDGAVSAEHQVQIPEAPPAPVSRPTQLAGSDAQSVEGQNDEVLSRSAQNALSQVSSRTEGVSTQAGPPPTIDLSGDADPAQVGTAQAQSAQEVQSAKLQAQQKIHQDFGENSVFPKASNETLKANKELTKIVPVVPEAAKEISLPGDAMGGLNQSLSPYLQEKIGVEQDKYQAGKTKFDTDSQQARLNADQEMAQATEDTRQQQLQEQQGVQAEVAQQRQEWQSEIDKADQSYQDKAARAGTEQKQKIDTEQTKGEEKANQHLRNAEQKAEAEKQKADDQAAKEKQEAEKESGGFWGWAKSAAKSLIDGLKSAVNAIYDGLRSVVKGIFEAAKKLAVAAIDLARDAIVGLIKGFGEILKGLVGVVFAAFPEIAKRINAKIDQAVQKAEAAINAAADLLKKGVTAILNALATAIDGILAAYQAMYNAILDAVGVVVEAILGVLEKIGNLVLAAKQMPDHFWGQMSEEVLGMDLTQPLAFERTAEDCAQCNVSSSVGMATATATATATGEGLSGAGSNNDGLAAMLSKETYTADDIAVDQVVPFEPDPEFFASLDLQDGGEVEFGESSDPANSMDAIKAELGGGAASVQEPGMADLTGETSEATPSDVAAVGTNSCCDDAATAQANLEKMMSQQVEGAESTQKQGEPANQGDIPANMKIGPLTPAQRASYMFSQLKKGIQQWFAANWGKLLAGTIAGITGFIALNALTGGAIWAAVPPFLQILGAVMAGVAMAQIAGHIGNYFSQGWAGKTTVAAKSLARAVAMGAIELVFALLFNAGAIFKALKGGIKGAAKAAAKSVKTAIKTTAKSAKDLAKIGAKGAKTAFKNGKIMLKGVKSGFAKGAKSVDDLVKRLKDKLTFNKFKIRRRAGKFQLLGHINPWIVLAENPDGDIQIETTGVKKNTPGSIFLDDEQLRFLKNLPDNLQDSDLKKISHLEQSGITKEQLEKLGLNLQRLNALKQNARRAKLVKLATDPKKRKFKKAPDYHGDTRHQMSDSVVKHIIGDPDGIYLSHDLKEIVYHKGGDIAVVRATGAQKGQTITAYGSSGLKGASGAKAFGGAPTDVSPPVTPAMITGGTIPTASGTVPPAIQIWP